MEKDGYSRYLGTQRAMVNLCFAGLKQGFDTRPHEGSWLVGRKTGETLSSCEGVAKGHMGGLEDGEQSGDAAFAISPVM